MGNLQGQSSRRTSSSSSYDRKSDTPDVIKKIDQKECIFIAMQSEIDKAITENDREAMKLLTSEIAAHIFDLNQLKKIQLTSTNRGRTQKLIYNFELSFAKLKSIYNHDTAMRKETNRRFSPSSSSSFYVDPVDSMKPDIVSDLVPLESRNSVSRSSSRKNENIPPPIPENGISRQLSRSDSLYSNQSQTSEEALIAIENEFGVLQEQAQRPVEDVNECYQMDKGVFYLYVKVKNLEFPESSVLRERKLTLIRNLSEFRTLLDRKSGELEELREMNQETNTLELLLDSTTDNEIVNLRARALLLQETLEKSLWDSHLTERKIELLRRLARFLERIAYTSPSSSVDKSVGNIYGNVNSLQEELDTLKAWPERNSTYPNMDNKGTRISIENKSENENDECIYGNIEIIRQNIEPRISPKLNRSGSSISQRQTVYVNEDIIRQTSSYENHDLPFEEDKLNREVITKRPLPLPRNYDDKVINDLPKYWQRLNEIFNKDSINDTDKSEIVDIQRHAELARNLFERKIRKLAVKLEDCVDL